MEASLCVKGCGFYGSSENKNMCSKCYRDFLKQEILRAPQSDHSPTKPSCSELRQGLQNLVLEEPKKLGLRCKCCNKKIGVLGFECQCGDVFCGTHRYPEAHSCCRIGDYKAKGRQALATQNPLCKADKLGERA